MRMRKDGVLHRQKCCYQDTAAFGPRGKVLACVLEELHEWQALVRKGEIVAKPAPVEVEAAVPTVDGLCRAYETIAAEQYAAAGSPRPGTVAANVARLRSIAAGIGLGGGDSVELMTPAAIKRWLADKVQAAGNDVEAQARARYSAWRTISIARSMWAVWTRQPYAAAGMMIPAVLDQWPHAARGAASAPQMQIPPDNLMADTIRAYNELERKDPRLWLAATLGLMFGMRPQADGSRATWDWFVNRGGEWWLEYTPSKTRGRTTEGSAVVSIRVPTGLYERMRAVNPAPGYVVSADDTTSRVDVFKRDLCAWQRANGVAPRTGRAD